MVKDELGRDAVILHTKRYRQGGFLGYKSKEVVESRQRWMMRLTVLV